MTSPLALSDFVAYGQTRPFWIPSDFILHAQPLCCCIRTRNCNLPRSRPNIDVIPPLAGLYALWHYSLLFRRLWMNPATTDISIRFSTRSATRLYHPDSNLSISHDLNDLGMILHNMVGGDHGRLKIRTRMVQASS